MYQSYKLSKDEINYFISIGGNGDYFKTDGQKYCVHLHIQKGDDCYLESCLCQFTQKEIEKDVIFMMNKVDEFLKNGINFEEKFTKALNEYPWLTSKMKNTGIFEEKEI